MMSDHDHRSEYNAMIEPVDMPVSAEEQMRAEFDDWYGVDTPGSFEGSSYSYCWQAWQASRAALSKQAAPAVKGLCTSCGDEIQELWGNPDTADAKKWRDQQAAPERPMLTDEVIQQMARDYIGFSTIAFARAIESAIRGEGK